MGVDTHGARNKGFRRERYLVPAAVHRVVVTCTAVTDGRAPRHVRQEGRAATQFAILVRKRVQAGAPLDRPVRVVFSGLGAVIRECDGQPSHAQAESPEREGERHPHPRLNGAALLGAIREHDFLIVCEARATGLIRIQAHAQWRVIFRLHCWTAHSFVKKSRQHH